ncbi:VanZ family protein [Pararhodonellum marinum]|uniref:VanZ family protein n=1 Tax=Pararhodonellum marinum TaxID=2755358 RepID=UPI00293BD4CC|nr:VanZ family protein [Pararhodonellum marinum]
MKKTVLALAWTGILLYAMLKPGNEIPDFPIFEGLDKIIHFILFFALTFLWARVLIKNNPENPEFLKLFTTFLVFGFIFAILVEWIQQYVPYRTFDAWDIVANVLGGACGIICYYLVDKQKSACISKNK